MTSDAPSLMNVSALPGYEAQLCQSGVAHSRAKLENAELSFDISSRRLMIPCATEEETLSYRCTCTFQLVKTCDQNKLHYAVRSQQSPVLLGSNVFSIATCRIQAAMKGLLYRLNETSSHHVLTKHLTSVSFVSSWNEADCIITMLYGAPFDEEAWKLQAKELCHELDLLSIIGRSKGRVVSVGSGKRTLSDTVWLSPNEAGFSASLEKGENASTPILYEKPVTAFFHPNGRVMLQALEWLMTRLQRIVVKDGPCNMLEMYCGCGAHTVALARTGLLKLIVAVELDGRLVDACVANCKRNECHYNGACRTPVHVVKGDAADWALKSQRARKRQGSNNSTLHAIDYQVLLVDPPRMGLDGVVCKMAMEGTFDHILYISCGRKALQRDLGILERCFDVVDCTLLDLFPRTDSVESLVHLQRRPIP